MAIDSTKSTPVMLPSTWKWMRLEDVCNGIFDCPHSTPVLTEDGPFLVRTQDIRTGIFQSREAAHVSEQTYRDRTARAEPLTGDLLFSREGTYFGTAAEVPNGVRVCLGQRMVLIRPNDRIVDTGFLRYWINSPVIAKHIEGFRDGSVAERLNLPTIRNIPVGVPSLGAQKSIVHVLRAFDDKIELNRKMNETLEAMARALFKSWFVDFDPVRAKSEGRAPSGMDAETAKLFPSEFVESELGRIPKGWSVTNLGDLLELKRGYDLPATHRKPGDVPIVSSSGPTGTHVEAKVSGPGIVTGRTGTIGRVFLVHEDFWPLNTTLYVRDLKGTKLHFAYHLLSGLDFDKFSDKAAVPGINRNHVHQEKVVAAPHELQRWFDGIAQTWTAQCQQHMNELLTLTQIRDTLLPRLLSGKLRVDPTTLDSQGA